ncbi:HAAS signaling domain-containing protein [[Eubacterium] cellulosolvens]
MSEQDIIQAYLKNIDAELVDVDSGLRNSILQEIEEHLTEKIEDVKISKKVTKLSSKKIKEILKEFGEPKEIAIEYRRQLDEAQEFGKRAKKSVTRSFILPFIGFIAIFILIVAVIYYSGYLDNNDNSGSEPEGPWLQAIAWKPNDDYCLVVGEGMPVVKYDGDNYTVIDSPYHSKYYDVAWHPSGDYALICGSEGMLLKFDGSYLTDLSLDINEKFSAIKFSPDGTYAIAVGTNSVIGIVTTNQSEYFYIPDNIVDSVDLDDLAWTGEGDQVLLVGYYSSTFTKGIMIKFTPGSDDVWNRTYSILPTPVHLSTCFSARWVEQWGCFLVTGNMGQLFMINEDWTIVEIQNTFSDIEPILDSVWHPIEKRVILVGGLIRWNEPEGIYELDKSTYHVLTTDGKNITLVDHGQGPHFLSCEWNPKDKTVIMIGAFSLAYEYKDGEISKLSVDY